LKIIFLLLSTFVLASGADKTIVNGKWQVHSTVAGQESDAICTFTQKETDLSGTCTTDQGTVNLIGTVDGKKISWSYKSQYEGTPLTVKFEGTLDSENKITGTVSVPEFSVDGDFTAAPAK